MTRSRRILLLLVVLFIVYAIIVSPNQSADLVGRAVDAIVRGVQSIFRFFDALLRR